MAISTVQCTDSGVQSSCSATPIRAPAASTTANTVRTRPGGAASSHRPSGTTNKIVPHVTAPTLPAARPEGKAPDPPGR